MPKGLVDLRFVIASGVAIGGLAVGHVLNNMTNQAPAASANFQNIADEQPQRYQGNGPAETGLLRLKDYIRNLERKNISLSEKVDTLSGLLDSKEKDLLKLSDDNSSLKDNLYKVLDSENKLKLEFNSNLSSLTNQLDKKESELLNLNTLKENLANQVNELSGKLSVLANAQPALESTLYQAQQDKASLSAELNKTSAELNKQLTLNETLSNTVDKLREDLANKEKERLNLLLELNAALESKRNLESELSLLRMGLDEGEKQVKQLNNHIKDLNLSYEESNASTSKDSSATGNILPNGREEKDMAQISDKLSAIESKVGTLKKQLKGIYSELDSIRPADSVGPEGIKEEAR